MSTLLLSVFALLISIEDLRKFKISNRLLGLLFLMLITKSLVMGTFFVDAFSGVIFLLIFSTVHLLGKFVSPDLAIGFGDVKLISVLTSWISFTRDFLYSFMVGLARANKP